MYGLSSKTLLAATGAMTGAAHAWHGSARNSRQQLQSRLFQDFIVAMPLHKCCDSITQCTIQCICFSNAGTSSKLPSYQRRKGVDAELLICAGQSTPVPSLLLFRSCQTDSRCFWGFPVMLILHIALTRWACFRGARQSSAFLVQVLQSVLLRLAAHAGIWRQRAAGSL